ncbi:hypothetical protein SCOCK_430048 [Actinacidiphila cocklensis]|uniref:Uncharacterized protein n=1 Tax=Actinacidiphila cocklensis TaxID=887465 RepID=A0A9W4GT48_9ACTN|nr:hypothetical protein SCOCK_430048 [Actinacidiphila cocklensis]
MRRTAGAADHTAERMGKSMGSGMQGPVRRRLRGAAGALTGTACRRGAMGAAATTRTSGSVTGRRGGRAEGKRRTRRLLRIPLLTVHVSILASELHPGQQCNCLN